MKLTTLPFRKYSPILLLALIGLVGLTSVAVAAIVSGDFSTNSSADVTITQLSLSKPASTTQGDFLLAHVAVNGGSGAVVSAPAGWTQIARTDNDVNLSVVTYYRVAGSSEPSSYTWSIDHQTTAKGGIIRYTGVNTSDPIDTFSGNVGFGTVATTTSITTSHGGSQIVTLLATDVGKNTNAGAYFTQLAGMLEKFDVSNVPFGPSIAADDVTQVTLGSTGSKSSTIAGNKARNWIAQQIAIRKQAVTTTQTFSTTQAWVVPAGVTSVNLKMWGAGGGGGGRDNGRGAGAGAYVSATNIAVTPGETIQVYVGQGGQGGDETIATAGLGGSGYALGGMGSVVNGSGGGGGGGSSAFITGLLSVIAAGGGGGPSDSGGSATFGAGAFETFGGSGGNGGNRGAGGGGGAATPGADASDTAGGTGGTDATVTSGFNGNGSETGQAGGGSSAGTSGSGNDGVGTSGGIGSGGATHGTNGAVGESGGGGNGGAAGENGGTPGAGGGGTDSLPGGNGGNGRVEITYFQ